MIHRRILKFLLKRKNSIIIFSSLSSSHITFRQPCFPPDHWIHNAKQHSSCIYSFSHWSQKSLTSKKKKKKKRKVNKSKRRIAERVSVNKQISLPPSREEAAVQCRERFADSSQYWRSYPSNTALIVSNFSPPTWKNNPNYLYFNSIKN